MYGHNKHLNLIKNLCKRAHEIIIVCDNTAVQAFNYNFSTNLPIRILQQHLLKITKELPLPVKTEWLRRDHPLIIKADSAGRKNLIFLSNRIYNKFQQMYNIQLYSDPIFYDFSNWGTFVNINVPTGYTLLLIFPYEMSRQFFINACKMILNFNQDVLIIAPIVWRSHWFRYFKVDMQKLDSSFYELSEHSKQFKIGYHFFQGSSA